MNATIMYKKNNKQNVLKIIEHNYRLKFSGATATTEYWSQKTFIIGKKERILNH